MRITKSQDVQYDTADSNLVINEQMIWNRLHDIQEIISSSNYIAKSCMQTLEDAIMVQTKVIEFSHKQI